MKSLLFIVKEFRPDAYKDLETELKEKGIELKSFVYTGFDIENILGRLTKEIKESGKDTLLVTDSPEIYDYIRVLGHDAVALAEKEEDFSLYLDARYIVMKPYEIEALYYERVWMRFNDIPWTIAVTDRLIIRETVESDVEDFYRIYKDPRMTRYTEKLYENIEEERKYTERKCIPFKASAYGPSSKRTMDVSSAAPDLSLEEASTTLKSATPSTPLSSTWALPKKL